MSLLTSAATDYQFMAVRHHVALPGAAFVPVLLKSMGDIRDLLSDRLHIERIMFSETSHPGTAESQTTHFLGAISGERFLTISLLAPVAPEHRLEPEECRWIYGRNGERDFLRIGDLPIISCRPRPEQQPAYLEGTFQAMQRRLLGCSLAGLGLVRPGSFQWEEDQFTAQYAQTEPGKGRIRILGPDGKDAPESEKAKVLTDLEAAPEDRQQQFTLVRSETRVNIHSAAELEADQPAPGSVEAEFLARREAKEWERLRKGIRGRLVRDEQGRATRIEMESEPSCRVEFDYGASANLPPPFPQRIKTFLGPPQFHSEFQTGERFIHWVRLSDQPLPDTALEPWPLLKEGAFFHGVLRPDGKSHVPDREEQRRLHEVLRARHLKFRQDRERERGEGQGD